MSIASAIQTKQQQIAAAYTACNNKGATIPETQNLTNLATCIGTIRTGGGSAVISSLSVTPSTSVQTITASGGVDGYSPISVAAVTSSIDANITANNIVSGVSILGVSGSATVLNGDTLSVTPTTSAQTLTPTSPKNGFTEVSVAAVTSSIDSNISAGNIKKDVTILGITGSYEGSGGGGSKYGANVDTFLGDVDGNGVLQKPTEQSDIVFSGVVKVNNSALESAFVGRKIKTVSFPDLTEILFAGCNSMLQNCTSLTTLSMPELTTVSGLNACYYLCRGCTALTTVSMPKLVSITNSNGCAHAFNGCSSLTSFNLPELTTVSGSTGMGQMLYDCTSLQTVDFPKIAVLTAGNACYYMCRGCKALTDIYFRKLTTSSFGSSTTQFSQMMNSTGNTVVHKIHFPSNLQSKISGLTGYPLFGGTSGYVTLVFDQPATS